MTYEFAKELRDAGFPMKNVAEVPEEFFVVNQDVYKLPTLSELIEACGSRFGSLINMKDHAADTTIDWSEFNWVAIAPRLNKYHKFRSRTERSGPTPEEAVAKLWLALNKK
jgi:hypothetical protein